MRFSLRLNNDLPVSVYTDLAKEAETLGFDQIWVSSDLFFRSAPVILTAMALNTSRISIGVGVLNPYTIHPAETAMLAATLDEVSGGRFLLGMASGAAEFLDWANIPRGKPIPELRQAVRTIRRLLDGDRPAAAAWSDEAYLRYPPPSGADDADGSGNAKPRVPIYIGGMGDRMLALAGEIGDGALPLLFPPERYYAARRLVDMGIARRGGDGGSGESSTQRNGENDDSGSGAGNGGNGDGAGNGGNIGGAGNASCRNNESVGNGGGAAGSDFDFATCIWASASVDVDAARRALALKVAYYGGAMNDALLSELGVAKSDFGPITQALIAERDEGKALGLVTDDMLRIGVAGDAAAIIRRLEPLVAAGAAHLSFGPPLGPDIGEAVGILGRVAAHFRG